MMDLVMITLIRNASYEVLTTETVFLQQSGPSVASVI